MERYLLSIEDADRALLLGRLGWLSRHPRCSLEPATAKAMLAAYLSAEGKKLNWRALRSAARVIPVDVIAAIEDAPKKHAEHLVAALAFSPDADALMFFVKHITETLREGRRAQSAKG